jgi:hypothetical protein
MRWRKIKDAQRRSYLQACDHAAYVIQLCSKNSEIRDVSVDFSRPLNVISVIGEHNGQPADLLEIGINYGHPWYAGSRGRHVGRKPVTEYVGSPQVQREIFRLFLAISRQQLQYRRHDMPPSERFPFQGIRITLHPRDSWLAEILFWHEPFHNPNRQYYVRETIRFIRKALSTNDASRDRKQAWIMNRFRGNLILQNPYILYSLFQKLYPDTSPSRWSSAPFYKLLMQDEEIIPTSFHYLMALHPHEPPEVDAYDLVVKFDGYRNGKRKGFAFKIHPVDYALSSPLNQSTDAHDTVFNDDGHDHLTFNNDSVLDGVPF